MGVFHKDAGIGREVGTAVLIAGLSALASELVRWGVEEMRAAVKPPPRDEERDRKAVQ